MELLDDRSSGWRHFATRPETVSWVRLRRHIQAMPGAALVDVACDPMNEAALIFTFRGHRFGVDLNNAGYRLTVEDPNCPDDVLTEVVEYVRRSI